MKENIMCSRILWGTGVDAVKFLYYCYVKEYQIDYIIEENPAINQFHGYTVYNAEKRFWSGKFIIIASKNYIEIRDELIKDGLREFTDFIYFEWLYKKVVWLHGNCHMGILKEYLMSSIKFKEAYSIYPTPLIQDYDKKYKHLPDAIIDNCDVWDHQDIQASNCFGYEFSDEYLKRRIQKTNPDALEIVFPNLFSMGGFYFPQNDITLVGCKNYIFENESIDNTKDTNGIFPHTDYIINQYLYEEDFDVNRIVDKCLQISILDEQMIVNYCTDCINKIRDRENCWDIKVSDYIEENYKKKKLFYDPGHPTNDLMEYMAKRVLEMLNIDHESVFCNNAMDSHELPIYPFVAYALNLQWNENTIRKSGKKLSAKMDMAEYIREYIWWRMDRDNRRMHKALQQVLDEDTRKIALFPYGSNAKYIEYIVNRYFDASITIQRYDNYIYDGQRVLPYCAIDKTDKEMIILITAADPVLEKELYDQVRKTIAPQRIVHIMRAVRR